MKPRPYIFAACLSALALTATAAWGDEDDEKRYFNARLGPVYVTFDASVSTEYTDNVNLSSGRTDPIISDLVISPRIGMVASTEISLQPKEETNRTTVSLAMSLGLRKHIFHPELDQNISDLSIAPNSTISFLLRPGPVKTRLYDTFSLQSDPVADGSLSNVTEFRRFTNIIGADNIWPVNSMTTANLGLMHRNLVALSLTGVNSSGQATSLSTNPYDSYADSASGSVMVKLLSFLDVGMSASVEADTFPSAPNQNSTMYSYGPVAVVRLSDYTTLTANAGETITQPAQGGSSTSTYGSLALANRLNQFYTQTLSVGRQSSLDMLGSLTQVNYVRYGASWRMNSHITISLGVSYQDVGYVDNGFHFSPYQSNSDYQLVQEDISTQYALSRKLTTRLAFRHSDKTSNDSIYNYTQNTVTWDLVYKF